MGLHSLGVVALMAVAGASPATYANAATVGVWSNVTPAAIDLNGASFNNDNYGIQDVVVDPARPSDLYAFTCFQGVWKSADFGLTWTKVNTGANAAALDGGKLWTAAIDPSVTRNPNTPPTLWTATGDVAAGVWKSTDGGVNWTSYPVDNSQVVAVSGNSYYGNDVYALAIDPYDSLHLIAGFHGNPGISESVDGGEHWNTIAVPSGIGASLYPAFVQTGVATATRNTWLTQAQWDSNTAGIWRTDDAGVTWTQVAAALEHKHGSTQFYQPGNGVIYAPSVNPNGVFRSIDGGQTWQQVSSELANAVFGTPTRLYSEDSFASGGAFIDPNPHWAPAAFGTQWSTMTAPSDMTNGAKRAAVTYDGSSYIIVSGNWLAGIWRYVEDENEIFSNGFE